MEGVGEEDEVDGMGEERAVGEVNETGVFAEFVAVATALVLMFGWTRCGVNITTSPVSAVALKPRCSRR